MPDKILIKGFKVMGRHGVTAEERERDQEFVVDLECELDLSAAGRADRIEHTVDYMELIADIRQVVSTESYNLLEALGDRLAQAVLRRPFVDRVVICISKQALSTADLTLAGIRIERGTVQSGLQDEELSPR
ncbi:MAG TPA: dihydroneopterin aldolase [Actinomycetota bacterium]|nr:dihydroneopterin aldolase [Actinomycetota bacterium]